MTVASAEWTNPGALERLALLRSTRTVAVVGASSKPERASNFVATYLLASTDFDVWFVTPTSIASASTAGRSAGLRNTSTRSGTTGSAARSG